MLFRNATAAPPPSSMRQHGFETEPLVSHVETHAIAAALTSHQVTTEDRFSGERCERLTFFSNDVSMEGERVVIDLPRARILDELTASIRIRSNCPNLRIGVRIRFPHQNDPRTNQPLAIELSGETYKQLGEWQQLICRTSNEAMQSRLLRLRSQLSDGIAPFKMDERNAYIDQLIISLQLPQGNSALQLDDLEVGPIVEPVKIVAEPVSAESRDVSRLTIVDDCIRKDGEPFFPIFTLYHGERLELIAKTGVNMLWVRDYEDAPLLAALEGMKIGGIAAPPQPTPEEAILKSSGIKTIPSGTSPIWAWILGIKVPIEDRKYISNWAEQVRDADREIRRPILADVAGDERGFHRHIDILSSSRFAIHTDVSSPDHFAELRGRRDHALPGKPMFTFVQTEASGPLLDYFSGRDIVPIVEPEQILHQGYEAIAAGYKGIGFWKQIPFDTTTSGLNERLEAIRIFSIHCRTLEPFLATGRIVDDISVQVGNGPSLESQRTPLGSRWDRAVTPAGHVAPQSGAAAEIRATVFQTAKGLLILLVWHEPGSQCVPGAQTAQAVRVLIRGIDASQAWEVTPTGVSQSNLDMDRVAGGTEVTLREFDQVAAIVVPTQPSDGEALRNFARQNRNEAAEAFVSLATAKYQRVSKVQEELIKVGAPVQPGIDIALEQAASAIDQAHLELRSQRADEARVASQRGMQYLRRIQRSHWDAAVDPMSGPTSTLEATSFQTLPEHWRLLAALGRQQRLGPNLLPSGSFDSEQEFLLSANQETGDGWADGSTSRQWTSLRLEQGGATEGGYLSMIVKPNAPAGEAAILTSPKIHVQPGDLILITGQVRVPYPLTGPGHQFSIFETLTGREGASVFKKKTENWTSFRTMRRAPREGILRLRLELAGPGIAQLDQLRIHVISGN
ncbi:MAG TPA: hypothetical protein VNQ76_19730 [Planctomicrobium sp.]|nr:hypothetical protein [Planctomicrobium sp.]